MDSINGAYSFWLSLIPFWGCLKAQRLTVERVLSAPRQTTIPPQCELRRNSRCADRMGGSAVVRACALGKRVRRYGDF